MLEKLSELRSRFTRVYWIALTFEMFERGAYYSMMPIIAIHAHYNLGFDLGTAAAITIFMYPFQYGLPLFSGALAEKIGYKKQMIFAFIFLTIAYFFLSYAFNFPTMVLAVMSVGIGIGSYKPLISATVAKCTKDADRNIAYGIYYWIVNLAAFVFPFVFAIIIMFDIITRPLFFIIFMICGIMISANIFTAIFIFEEVPRTGIVKTYRDVVNNVKTAMSDKKFVVMVVLIGGFWALYSTMLNALPLIIFGFRWDPWFFNEMLLGTFNPLTIIALGAFISKYIERIEPMRVILSGLTIYIIGLSIIGFFIQSWSIVVIGIVIVSIGEFMIAPGYLAFISKLAPKEKVSAYIGCNFISYMIGLLGGTLVFSLILDYVAETMEMPNFFYGIIISFGLFLLFAFIMYYKTWGQDVMRRSKEIRMLEEGYVEEDNLPEDFQEPIIFRIFDNKLANILPLLLIPLVLFASFSYGTFHYYGPEEEEKVKPIALIEASDGFKTPGYTGENQYFDVTFEIIEEEARLKWINCTLTWSDGASQFPGGTNEPDNFELSIIGPNESVKSKVSVSNDERIVLEHPLNWEEVTNWKDTYVGTWTIRVAAGVCGDDIPLVLPSIRTEPDDGNDWSLECKYTYMTEKKETSK